MRLLVASTPRSGNTWVRMLLAHLFELPQLAGHTPGEIDWRGVPDRCIVQLHWLPTEEIVALLSRHGFRTIVVARHPLDVLISILHFAPREPQTARWLDGRWGDESAILGRSPSDAAVVDYACSPRFRALLEVSAQWWGRPAAARIRYEDLLDDPHGALGKLAAQIGTPLRSISSAVEAHSLERLQPVSGNAHFWQGQSGLWSRLLDARAAQAIYAAQYSCFDTLGYDVGAARSLTPESASSAWTEIA